MVKIISQKTLFKNNYFNLVENKIDFGNNIIKTHADVYRKSAVSVFPITSSYEIYLIKQYRYLLEKEVLEAVAGIMDKDENSLETAKRELKEETGIVAGKLSELQSIFVAGSFVKIRQYLILAQDLKFEEATPEETEKIELVKMSLDEAVNKVFTGEIMTGSSMLGVLLLDKMRERGEI